MHHPVRYGKHPCSIAVVHGGPGMAGYMAPLALELSSLHGVVEPYLLDESVEGQIRNLFTVLNDTCHFPVVLIGHSWGAWLSLLFTARYPQLVGRLVMVGAGAFDERYKTDIESTRLERLTPTERSEAITLSDTLRREGPEAGAETMKRFGYLMSKADSFLVDDDSLAGTIYSPAVYSKVWNEASKMRQSGELLRSARLVRCPALAIHGAYDPHPAAGVEYPLRKVISGFRFVLLEDCGHYPWRELKAREDFFRELNAFLPMTAR